METIRDTFFEGERPLYGTDGIALENVKFYPGESALKEARNVRANNCNFMGKYPFWHNENSEVHNSVFTIYGRAAIWYSKNFKMYNTLVEAPKMFREMDGLYVENVQMPNAQETCWFSRDIEFKNVKIKQGDYIFMNSSNIKLSNVELQGNYSFQDAKNVEIHDSVIMSRDAFWKVENVTVYNSVVIGEYLGWHSKNLKFVNCKIGGTQPLCYAQNLVLENCEFMDDCDLSFEFSTLEADITTPILSVKNPISGSIKAPGIGEIIFDEYQRNPGGCTIEITKTEKIS